MITQERVRELFHYEEDTGNLVRIKTVSRSPRSKVGQRAGAKASHGYLATMVDGTHYLNHRLIWLYVHGKFPEEQLDHIDQDRLNNRLSNLRAVTHQENNKNRRRQSNNTSGLCGVHLTKNTGKWEAHIKANGKKKHLGHFSDFFEACCARKSAENKYNFHPNHGRR